jgi:predicted DNA-binding transcriptional regulator AlpA
MERTGFGRDTVYRLARLGKFPKPFKLSEDGNASGWLEAEIDQFIEQRAATRGNAAA